MAYVLHEREWGDIHRHSRQGGGGLYHPPEDTKKYQSPSQEVVEGRGGTRKRQAASMSTLKQTNRSHDVSLPGPSEALHVQEKRFDTSKRPTLATAQGPDLLAGPSLCLNPLGANMSPSSSAHETHQLRYIVPTGPTLQGNGIFPELRRQHKLLDFATEDLSLRLGQTLAGLLNATLGNAVELTVAIIALVKCELVVMQTSLIGSILSNLLLVLGMCFFAGWYSFLGTSQSPAVSILSPRKRTIFLLPATGTELRFSYSSSVPLCSSYFRTRITTRAIVQTCRSPPASSAPRPHNVNEGSMEEEEAKPQMSSQMAIALFAVVTVVVAITAEILVDSIDGLTESGHINKEHAGLILLLPLVGNAAIDIAISQLSP
ncbi:hypothetical protein EDB86DRAFT_106351 [Lactarius hatsudake]|nr:hypothetical protein EDB86DRAFT_106351 [Lactarius hatsudake]